MLLKGGIFVERTKRLIRLSRNSSKPNIGRRENANRLFKFI